MILRFIIHAPLAVISVQSIVFDIIALIENLDTIDIAHPTNAYSLPRNHCL